MQTSKSKAAYMKRDFDQQLSDLNQDLKRSKEIAQGVKEWEVAEKKMSEEVKLGVEKMMEWWC